LTTGQKNLGEASEGAVEAPSELNLLDLGEDLVGIRQLALAVPLDEPDDPLLVDDERRAAVGVPVGPVHAGVLADAPLDVGQERIVRDTDRLGPGLVAQRALRTDT